MQTTYAALMAACEKAGQWDLAVALFDKMSAQVGAPLPIRGHGTYAMGPAGPVRAAAALNAHWC